MNDIEAILRRLIREEIRAAFDQIMPQIVRPSALQMPISDEVLLLSTSDAAKMLGISNRKLFSLTQSGCLPCVRIGWSKHYSVEALKKWIQATEAQPSIHLPRTKKPRVESVPRDTTLKAVQNKRVSKGASKAQRNVNPQESVSPRQRVL